MVDESAEKFFSIILSLGLNSEDVYSSKNSYIFSLLFFIDIAMADLFFSFIFFEFSIFCFLLYYSNLNYNLIIFLNFSIKSMVLSTVLNSPILLIM